MSLEILATNSTLQSEVNITRVLAGVVFEGLEGKNPTIRIRTDNSEVVDTSRLVDRYHISCRKLDTTVYRHIRLI